MRFLKSFVALCMVFLMSAGSAVAQNWSTLDGMKFVITSKSQRTCTLKAIEYIDEPTVVIPDSVEIEGAKYGVSSISKSAFSEFENKDQIKAVVLPNGIEEIGRKAFYGCDGLEKIDLPKSLKRIGECAFWECSSLKSIVIPSGVTAIESYAFADCKGLGKVEFAMPSHLERIDDAFKGCVSLTTIQIPKSCKTLSRDAFFDSGLKTLYVGRDTQLVGSGMFPDGCQGKYY